MAPLPLRSLGYLSGAHSHLDWIVISTEAGGLDFKSSTTLSESFLLNYNSGKKRHTMPTKSCLYTPCLLHSREFKRCDSSDNLSNLKEAITSGGHHWGWIVVLVLQAPVYNQLHKLCLCSGGIKLAECSASAETGEGACKMSACPIPLHEQFFPSLRGTLLLLEQPALTGGEKVKF